MFVKRDNNGNIIAISQQFSDGFCEEEIPYGSPELLLFIQENTPAEPTVAFQASDRDLIRVLEDLIDLLTAKGLIQFTDLPKAAQQKLISRQSIRRKMKGLNLLSDNPDEETIHIS